MSAETDIAALDNGGLNTVAEARTALTSVLRAGRAPYSIGDADDVWWEGDFASFTEIEPTGTSVATEFPGVLSALYSGQSADDLTCYVKARTFAVGDEWVTRIRGGLGTTNHVMGGLCFTDGTATTSNIVSLLAYVSPADNNAKINCFHGTVTNAATAVTMLNSGVENYFLDGAYIRLRYSAANTFQMAASADGLIWSAFGASDISKTMTPTHIGVCVSKWGGGR